MLARTRWHEPTQALRRLLHSGFRWTSHRGEVVDRETCIDNNTFTGLVWKRQSFSELRSGLSAATN